MNNLGTTPPIHTFWYHTSCPLSRQLKTLMDALQMSYSLRVVEYWNLNNPLYSITPLGAVPVLERKNFGAMYGSYAVLEYLLTIYPNFHAFPRGIKLMSQARSMLYLINDKFYAQVSKRILQEKLIKFLLKSGESPDRKVLAAAGQAQRDYMEYFSSLVKTNTFLLYDKLSVVDLALASHISILDYFGLVDWYKHPMVRDWYRVIKSLPYFRGILQERIESFTPPEYYLEPDF